MAESQLLDEVDEITSEIGASPESVESEQVQLSPSPGNSDEMLKELLFRQKGLDTLLNHFLEEQTQTNMKNNTQIEDLKQCITTFQTVEGNWNPAGRTGALASDRGATDTTLGNPWLSSKDPGGTVIKRPGMDLNSTIYFGPEREENPQQHVQSLEGATHASIGTRSGVQDKIGRVQDKIGRVQDNTSRVFDHESKAWEEARRSLEEERKLLKEERRVLEEEKKQMFPGTGARPKEFVQRRNEQEVEGTFGLNYLHLNRWDDPSDDEVTFRNAPIRRHDRLEPKITSKPRSLDQTNVRSCSNLEFSVAGDNPNGMDPREQPRHRPVFALEGRAADPSHFTTDDSGRATTLASKFSFPTRNEDLSTKIVSSQFTLKQGESAGLHLNQSSDVYRPNTLRSFELNRKKSDNTSVIYSTSSMFARASQQSQPCLSSVVHERVKEPISVMSASDFIDANMTQQNVVRGDKITCTASNNTFSCISQWYHDNYSCPLSCEDTIMTHLLGEYLCTLKCIVRGKDYFFTALKAVVVEAPTILGTIAAIIVIPIVIIILVVLIAVCIVRRNRREDKQKCQEEIHLLEISEEQLAVLYSKDGVQNRVTRERPLDNVAEDEIELVYKIREEEEQAIRGVAILRKKMFIVRQILKKSQLEVYDCGNNFNRELLNVSKLVDAVDICSCKTNNCLYIMDKKDGSTPNEVLKISTEGELKSNWSPEGFFGGYLSATTEGNVIITIQLKHMLLEYSPDGKALREIKLPVSLRISPRHAIKLDNDLYIVSHGTPFDRFHRVCHVDGGGNVVKSFGRESGSAEDQLNAPYYLAATRSGCVIVADLGNNRVLLLDRNLEFKANIVPKYKQRFECPRRVYLDETLGLLVVVISKGNTEEGNPEGVEASKLIDKDCRLLVFNIKPLLQKYT